MVRATNSSKAHAGMVPRVDSHTPRLGVAAHTLRLTSTTTLDTNFDSGAAQRCVLCLDTCSGHICADMNSKTYQLRLQASTRSTPETIWSIRVMSHNVLADKLVRSLPLYFHMLCGTCSFQSAQPANIAGI